MKIDYKIFNQETAIDRFIFAIENGYFVEAHELLEDDWNMYKKQGEINKALVLKGLINGATALALYHIKKKEEGYKNSDWVIDIGPEGGSKGGNIVDEGTPEFLAQNHKNSGSYTGYYLDKEING